ncbi:MAG: class I SAM-dependent RNA methyltransferase [Polyangiales bacterium]
MSQHPTDDPERPFFATAAKGTEGALRDELRELRLPRVKATRGGVYFGGDFEAAMRACLHSRIAVRVLERQQSCVAPDADALYEQVREVPWERVLDARRTLCVDAQIRDTAVTSSAFAAQRVKDAIVDRLRDKHGARPDVDKRDPDVRVSLHWVGEHATLSLDVGGAALHARGYRPEAGEAPLKETLAAAIVRLCGWDRRTPFIDPMCGAGTLAIEAAQWARAIAPGLARPRFGFERWVCHDDAQRRLAAGLREHARGNAKPASDAPPIFGRDNDSKALALARDNAGRAGVTLALRQADVRAIEPEHERAFLVTNPPYGERLPTTAAFSSELATALARLRGYRVCVLCHERALPRAMQRRAELEHALWNGPLECRLFCWEL